MLLVRISTFLRLRELKSEWSFLMCSCSILCLTQVLLTCLSYLTSPNTPNTTDAQNHHDTSLFPTQIQSNFSYRSLPRGSTLSNLLIPIGQRRGFRCLNASDSPSALAHMTSHNWLDQARAALWSGMCQLRFLRFLYPTNKERLSTINN